MSATQLEVAAAPLTLLADVAARLNTEHEIVRKATDVLECVVRSTGAAECSLWLVTPQGLVCAARAGKSGVAAAQVSEGMEGGGRDGLLVRRLVAGASRMGALALRTEGPVPSEVGVAFGVVANMLAPVLGWAERTRELEGEVARHTRAADEERRFIHQVVDSLPVSLYVIDRAYRVSVWNRGRESGSQGVRRDLALGKTIFEILHRAPAEKLRREFDEVFRTARIQQYHLETKATGEPRTYRITKIPMQLVEGEPPTHVITIGEDVTDFSASQERFAQSEKLAAMGQLAAGVMHEVNNPLATITACADSLGARFDDLAEEGVRVPGAARDTLGIIQSEVARCKTIVGSLLDFARPVSKDKAMTDVNAVVEQALSLLRHQQQFKRLQMQSFLDQDLPRIMASSEQLLQVFIAMLQNAADATEHDGSITVRTRRGPSTHEAVIAEVIDEGRGIARSDLQHIFEPFYTTKEPGRGTGLGLSICYSIVTGHGGRIEVDSAVGAGSTFRLLLPEGIPT
ncbi:MAG: PAS domain-containing protein [Gemmatimonadaceae bacterium]|nr:PAS domain-containing protein [Gemmatimonadaceae bacterium]